MLAPVVFLAVFSSLAAVPADEPQASCVGLVLDENNHPLAGARVTAFELTSDGDGWGRSRKRELASVTTGADGLFRFEATDVAKCAVVEATKAGKCFDARCPRLGGSRRMILRLGPAAELHGTVVDDAGVPVAGVDVRVAFSGSNVLPDETRATTTDTKGRFCVSDLARTATVGLDMSAPRYARALAKGPFVPGQRGLRFVLPPEGRIEGTVVSKDTGKPLPNVRLSAMSGVPSGMHHAYAKTDRTGHFAMSGLSGGKYTLETAGEIVANELTPPEWIGSIEKVAVETGSCTSNVTVQAVQGGWLEIVVTDLATGRPVKDPNGVLIVSHEGDLRIDHWATPSKDGVRRLRLRPGRYVITGAITTA